MTKSEYQAMTLRELREICKYDAKYQGHWSQSRKACVIEFMLLCDEAEFDAQQAVEESVPNSMAPKMEASAAPAPGEAASIAPAPQSQQSVVPTAVPAALKKVEISPVEYLDDIAMPAPFWSCQIERSLHWGKWRFGEGESRQHGKYLSIANASLSKHWIILWDWHSFEAACKELIYGLERLGEVAFLPSPGYLPAPPVPEEDEGAGDESEECVNCHGTGECPGWHKGKDCEWCAGDCPTLGYCVLCGGDEGEEHPGGGGRRREPNSEHCNSKTVSVGVPV